MQHVQLADKLYQDAQRRAMEAGFSSVDEYVADVVSNDLLDDGEENPDLNHLFTPELLVEVQKSEAEIDAGKGVTSEQFDEQIKSWMVEAKGKAGRQ